MQCRVLTVLPRAGPLVAGVCAALAFLVARPAPAQQISYTIIPAAEFVTWDDDLALEDDWLAGVRFSLRFGPYIELSPFYLTRRGLDLDPDRADDVFGIPAANASPNIEHFGAKVQANFGRQGLIPFLRLGGGVIRIDPESAPRHDRVAVSAGGGLRFGLSWLQGEVFAEQLAFRLDPGRLFQGGTPAAGRAPLHRNVAYGAAVMIPLSDVDPDVPGMGLRGTTAPIEPFIGRLNYSGDRLPDQDLFGVRAGIDFTRLVGVRGFYWRGAGDNFSETDPISGYGAELQFNLNTGPGISPFLIVGGGQLDYGSGFSVPGGAPDDQTTLILGGGLTFRLWERIGLNVALRDYVLSFDEPLDATGDPDELTHNTVVSAGLGVSIGGNVVSREETRRAAERPHVEIERLRAQIDSLQRETALAERQRVEADTLADTLAVDTAAAPADTAAAPTDTVSEVRRLLQSGMAERTRLVVAPAPTQGEVIFRYGYPPTAAQRDTTAAAEDRITLDDIRNVVRAELRGDTSAQRIAARAPAETPPVQPPAQPTAPPAQPPTQPVAPPTQPPTPPVTPPAQPPTQSVTPPAQPPPAAADTATLAAPGLTSQQVERRLAALESRILQRLEDLEERLRVQAEAAQAAQRQAVTQRESAGEVQEPSRSLFARLADFQSEDLRPFIGSTLNDETQFVLSARADLGPLTPDSHFRLWPEIAFSFGGGERTLLALANLQYPFPTFGGGGAFQPYVLGGIGIFSETAVALNTAIGANYNLRAGRGAPLFAFLELQGLNLFDYSRLLVGVSMNR
ncbi:MAG TPA: hypothetical protein VF178_16060 [Gemmatimonadaceae bacterium]